MSWIKYPAQSSTWNTSSTSILKYFDIRSINSADDFDSFRPGTDLMMPLKNIVNEFYAKDISKKVSTAHRKKWTTDEYMCGFAPYGYLKSKTEKNRIVVDEATAGNVRLEKKVKSLSSKKMMLYSDYKDDKLTREEYVKRSKAMVEQIDELHQEIEQLKTEIPPEDNSSSKFETQLESIIKMESFDREKIQKVIKKVIINGEDNIEIVWNTDDPFFK